MTFSNVIALIISVVGQFSSFFALFYLFMVIKDKIRKPNSPYKLTPKEHEEWCRNRLILNSLLCILYAFIFVMHILSLTIGFFAGIIVLLVVYVLRVKNNLKFVK